MKKNKKEKNKRFLIFGAAILIFLALFLPAYFFYHVREARSSAFAKETEKPLLVHTLVVHQENQETELVLPSFLDAINITPIWARTNGYLTDWLVDIGDKVKQGDLLATIDTPDVDQEVVQAEGDLAAAIARESIARVTEERGTELFQLNPDAISREELDQMIAAHDQSLADIQAANGRVNRFRYLQGFKNLYAPFDGTIIERDIDIGSLITAGSTLAAQQMFQIAKSDILRAFVNVPQNYFHMIQDGMEAEITVPQFPKKIFTGRINRNAGALDPLARTLLTQVNIDNKKGELLPGLYTEVKFKFKPEKGTGNFIVPIEAVIFRTGPALVALVDKDNTVHLKEVKIGRDYGAKVEIVEGLSDGDEIVNPATDRIKNGMEIKRVIQTQRNRTRGV